jgi:hypothetical protein
MSRSVSRTCPASDRRGGAGAAASVVMVTGSPVPGTACEVAPAATGLRPCWHAGRAGGEGREGHRSLTGGPGLSRAGASGAERFRFELVAVAVQLGLKAVGDVLGNLKQHVHGEHPFAEVVIHRDVSLGARAGGGVRPEGGAVDVMGAE